MTRNESPVFLIYPPDESSRRESQSVRFQYANPNQRAAAERFFTIPNPSQPDISRQQNNDRPPSSSRTRRNETTHPQPERYTPVRRTVQYIRGGNYTSSESSSGSHSRPRIPTTATTYWYCCRQCGAPGHIERMYTSCLLCDHPRCNQCTREVFYLRERS